MAVAYAAAPAGDVDAIVIGAGFAGLAMLHELRRLGFSAHVLEAGNGIGGTWFWNRYPGARCDVDSADYSYSFSDELQQEWRWSERYATQPEILRYVNHVADRFHLRPHITLNARVSRAVWDEASARWTVETESGLECRARYLISAVGCLSAAKRPDVPDLDSYRGSVVHTADWPVEGVDLQGRRVGVIGTGSSGIQVIPEIAPMVGELIVFQRTPNFSVPANHQPLTEEDRRAVIASYARRRELARNSPTGLAAVKANPQSALAVGPKERRAHYEQWWATAGFGFLLSYGDLLLDQRANDTAAEFIRSKIAERVKDPAVAELLMPRGYPYGAKRPCVDNGYFEAFNRPNVQLVDLRATPLVRATRLGSATTEARYDLDVVIFATGFDAMTGSMLKLDIIGVNGKSLRDHWRAGPLTLLGVATSGFPNMFIVAGPGSPSLLGNVMVSIEQHVSWISQLLVRLREEGHPIIEATPEAESRWVRHVNRTAARTLYMRADSYYLGAEIPGKPRVFMPYAGGLRRYRRECEQVAADHYAGFEHRWPQVSIVA